ncbi:MAG: DUF1289 domain-containing protein [Gammaproteobacteria bacterium]|jgi:predicted Fe-S protein YdhL (DUF1289 family)
MLIDTPCIGICSSVYGDAICRGCKRTAKEVIDWNRFTTAEKLAIYQRLQAQIADVFLKYIDIVDANKLQEKITQHNIRLHPHVLDVEKAFHLLRLGANKINQINAYGLQIKLEFSYLSLTELFNKIDSEIYQKAITSK